MSNHFTAPIENDPGFTLAQYARRAATAFPDVDNVGATRVESVNPHYEDHLVETRNLLAEYEQMDRATIELKCASSNQSILERWESDQARTRQWAARFRAMQAQVEAWDAPQVLSKLRDLMLRQIATELAKHTGRDAPTPMLPGNWRWEMLDHLRGNVERAENKLEVQRTNIRERNEFVDALLQEFPLDAGDSGQSR